MIYTVHSILQYFGLKGGLGEQPGHKAEEGAGSADNDQNLNASSTCSTERRCDAVGSRTHVSARWLLDDRTQSMPLSAIIKQRLVCSAHAAPNSMLRSAAATNFAFPPSAQR